MYVLAAAVAAAAVAAAAVAAATMDIQNGGSNHSYNKWLSITKKIANRYCNSSSATTCKRCYISNTAMS